MAEANKAILMITVLFVVGVYLLSTAERRYESFRRAAKKGLLFPTSNNDYYGRRGNKTTVIGMIKLIGGLFLVIPVILLIVGFSKGGIFWQHFSR